MAQANTRSYGEVSALEKLGCLRMIGNAVNAGVLALATAPFRDRDSTPPTVGRHVFYSMIRAGLGSGSLGQLQYMLPRTTEAYQQLASQKRFPVKTVDHPLTGCKSHYIGSSAAKTVLLYLHGGGYVMPASAAHLEYLYTLVKDVNTSAGDEEAFSVLISAYSLAPEFPYPTALAQAADTLNYLLQEERRDPHSIIVGGDSAGGNLALSLLSHIMHPHPDLIVPRTAVLTSPLKGALLISPWVEFDTTKRNSFKTNVLNDVSSATALASWGPEVMAGRPSDNYIEAINAGVEWWRGLDKAVDHVLVWGGGGEVLIDGIKIVMDNMKAACPATVQTVVGHKMCHEEMVVNVMLGYKKGESEAVVEGWLKGRL